MSELDDVVERGASDPGCRRRRWARPCGEAPWRASTRRAAAAAATRRSPRATPRGPPRRSRSAARRSGSGSGARSRGADRGPSRSSGRRAGSSSMASALQPVAHRPQPRQSAASNVRPAVRAADDRLERAAQAAAAAALAEVHVDAGDVPAHRPHVAHPPAAPRRGAGSSSRCSSCRWTGVAPGRPRRSAVCISPALSVARRISTARSLEISQPRPRSFSKRRQTSFGLRHLLDDRAAVARPQVDALLGGDDRLGLVRAARRSTGPRTSRRDGRRGPPRRRARIFSA